MLLLLVAASCGNSPTADSSAPHGATSATSDTRVPSAPASARLVADVRAIAPGEAFRVGVLIEMKPGWHVYWKNPGEAGLPTEVKISAPRGFEVGELAWPIPKRFSQPGDILGYGYEDQVLFVSELRAPRTLRPGDRAALSAEVRWLACEKVCIPGNASLSLDLPVRAEPEPDAVALFATWSGRLPTESGRPGAPATVDAKGRLSKRDSEGSPLAIELIWSAPVSDVDWFPVPGEALEISDVRLEHDAARSKIEFRATELAGVGTPSDSFESLVVYSESPDSRRALRVRVPLRRT